MLSVFLILVGFFVLIYGANFLVDGASALAAKLNVPNIVIGLTIVAFGTSAPELVVNSFASANGNPQIVMGNVIGSNIFNIAAILGISAMIYPLSVKTNTTWIEIPLAFLAVAVVFIMSNDVFLNREAVNIITRSEGIILLAFFGIFLAYNIHVSIANKEVEEIGVKNMPIIKSSALILLGLVMLVIGGKLIVEYAVKIAQMLGLSERVIALTIVSIGTSLPELATSIVAVRKRNVDIAVGNVVGSNIFNVFLILGVSSVVGEIPITPENQYDILVNIFFSLLLFLFIFTGKGRRIERWEGALLVCGVIAYITSLLVVG